MNKKIEAVEAKAEVAMKIPMEPQRKSMSESNVPKATFHEPVPAPKKTDKENLFTKIKNLVEEAKYHAREGASGNFLTEFINEKIRPKINLYGAEYLGYGGAQELLDEFYDEILVVYQSHEPVPAPKKETQEEIHHDNVRRAKEKEEKIKSADEELKQLMAEALEASKEGGKFKRRDNWKGKAGYMKKIDNLWKKYPAGIDRFRRAIPFDFGWSPS